MDTLNIQKDGKIYKKGQPVTGNILALLGQQVRLSEQVSLFSFFSMIGRYPELMQISDMLSPLHDIFCRAPKGGEGRDLDRLIFYKTIEISGFPGPASLNIYHSLKGQQGDVLKELKFFHLETLLEYQLFLGKLNHIVFGDKEDIFQFETVYTLFELVEGIAWELSFNFNPLQCSLRR